MTLNNEQKQSLHNEWLITTLLADLNAGNDGLPITTDDIDDIDDKLIEDTGMYGLKRGEKLHLFTITFKDGRKGALKYKKAEGL